MRHLLSSSTSEFLSLAAAALEYNGAQRPGLFNLDRYFGNKMLTVDEARNRILELEERAKSYSDARSTEQANDIKHLDPRFPIYSEVVEIISIYRDAISLERRRPVVKPSEIPSLLFLLRIPKCDDGLDLENHGFGYHFHYGKVDRKSRTVDRTNLLLTFDPKNELPKRRANASRPALYAEYHADGKCKRIDAETIGSNKRYPIYLVCLDKGEKRGLEHFKRPSKGCAIFYSGSL